MISEEIFFDDRVLFVINEEDVKPSVSSTQDDTASNIKDSIQRCIMNYDSISDRISHFNDLISKNSIDKFKNAI